MSHPAELLLAEGSLDMQGGLKPEPSKAEYRAAPGLPWQQQALEPLQALSRQLQELFSEGLLKTTLLLQFIWFTNGLAYYGLVLLTTSVSPYPTLKSSLL